MLEVFLAILSMGDSVGFRPLIDQKQTHFAPIFNGCNGR